MHLILRFHTPPHHNNIPQSSVTVYNSQEVWIFFPDVFGEMSIDKYVLYIIQTRSDAAGICSRLYTKGGSLVICKKFSSQISPQEKGNFERNVLVPVIWADHCLGLLLSDDILGRRTGELSIIIRFPHNLILSPFLIKKSGTQNLRHQKRGACCLTILSFHWPLTRNCDTVMLLGLESSILKLAKSPVPNQSSHQK